MHRSRRERECVSECSKFISLPRFNLVSAHKIFTTALHGPRCIWFLLPLHSASASNSSVPRLETSSVLVINLSSVQKEKAC